MVTPEELCEIEEIKNLRYLYAHYYDGNRTDELVDLFTGRRGVRLRRELREVGREGGDSA